MSLRHNIDLYLPVSTTWRRGLALIADWPQNNARLYIPKLPEANKRIMAGTQCKTFPSLEIVIRIGLENYRTYLGKEGRGNVWDVTSSCTIVGIYFF